MKIQLRNKLLIIFLSMTLVSILIISLVFTINFQQQFEEDFLKSNKKELKLINKTINMFLRSVSNDVRYAAKHPLIKGVDDSITKYMKIEKEVMMRPSKAGGLETKIYNFYKKIMQSRQYRYAYLGTIHGGLVQYPEGKIFKKYDPRIRFWYKKAMDNPGRVIMTKAYYYKPDDSTDVILAHTIKNAKGKIVGVQAIEVSLDFLTSIVKSFTIGETGYIILMQKDGTILADAKNPSNNFKKINKIGIKNADFKNLKVHQEWLINGKAYIVNFYNESDEKSSELLTGRNWKLSFPIYQLPIGANWQLVGLIQKVEFIRKIKPIIRLIFFISLALIFSVIFLSLFFSKKLTTPIKDLVEASEKVIKGNYNVRVNIKTNDEFFMLGKTFNHMIETIKTNIKMLDDRVAKRTKELSNLYKKQKALLDEMESELTMAQKLQQHFIPKSPPLIDNVKFHFIYKPMSEIGGDLYDFIEFKKGEKTGIFISDVSGHGVPAALISSMVKSLINVTGEHRHSPNIMLDYLNTNLLGQTRGNFLTAFYGIYQNENKKLLYARAAHNFPWLLRDGEIIELKSEGRLLGVLNDISFEEKEIQLKKGDKILFYTDGLIEAVNEQGIEFEERLIKLLREKFNNHIDSLVETVYKELQIFHGSDRFEDDVCILGMEIF